MADVRIYNRSARRFIHGAHIAAPNTFTTVPQDVAERWMKLFPDEVVASEVAQQEINGSAAQIAVLKEQLKAAQLRINELEKHVPAKVLKGVAKTPSLSDSI